MGLYNRSIYITLFFTSRLWPNLITWHVPKDVDKKRLAHLERKSIRKFASEAIIEDMIFNNIKRPIFLYRGVEVFDDLYMHDLSLEWANSLDAFTYIPVCEKKSENSSQLRIGLVHQAVLEDFQSFDNVQVYCCGAPGLVKTASESFIDKGLLKSVVSSKKIALS